MACWFRKSYVMHGAAIKSSSTLVVSILIYIHSHTAFALDIADRINRNSKAFKAFIKWMICLVNNELSVPQQTVLFNEMLWSFQSSLISTRILMICRHHCNWKKNAKKSVWNGLKRWDLKICSENMWDNFQEWKVKLIPNVKIGKLFAFQSVQFNSIQIVNWIRWISFEFWPTVCFEADVKYIHLQKVDSSSV